MLGVFYNKFVGNRISHFSLPALVSQVDRICNEDLQNCFCTNLAIHSYTWFSPKHRRLAPLASTGNTHMKYKWSHLFRIYQKVFQVLHKNGWRSVMTLHLDTCSLVSGAKSPNYSIILSPARVSALKKTSHIFSL